MPWPASERLGTEEKVARRAEAYRNHEYDCEASKPQRCVPRALVDPGNGGAPTIQSMGLISQPRCPPLTRVRRPSTDLDARRRRKPPRRNRIEGLHLVVPSHREAILNEVDRKS